jgi:hypothetical protein
LEKKLIGISGLIGSGKDTAGDYLHRFYHFTRISFADSLKDAVSVVFGWDRELLQGQTQESRIWREEVDQWWANRLGISHLTPRWTLQNIGTNVFREHFHSDIWIASVENRIMKHSRVVITDCRFENEMTAIRNLGGAMLRVNRGKIPDWVEVARRSKTELASKYPQIHPSEWNAVTFDVDHEIDNNGDLAHIYRQIDELVE